MQKSILIIFLISILLSCSQLEKDNYNTKENYDLLNKKVQDFADHMNTKKYTIDISWKNYYRKIKKKKKIVKGKKGYLMTIGIPYFVTDEALKYLLEKVAEEHKRELSFIDIDAVHAGIEDFSGIVANYRYETTNSNNLKANISYTNYLSKKRLEKKGITHHLLKYDHGILLSFQEEKRKHKSKSKEYIKAFIVKKYGVSRAYLNNLLHFAYKYYKH